MVDFLDTFLNLNTFVTSVTPSEAYDIYKAGFGSSGTAGLGNLFNKYRIKFAFVEDNKEVNSFEL